MQRVDRNKKRLNDRTRDGAHKHYAEWTGPELELAARSDLSASQVAGMIGRSMYAVKHKRRQLLVDPRAEALAGITDDAARAAVERVLRSAEEGRRRRLQNLDTRKDPAHEGRGE